MGEEEHIERREEAVLDYLDETLSGEELRDFEAHLAGCPRCREAIEEQRAALTLLAAVPAAAPPPELEQRILQRLGPAARRQATPRQAGTAQGRAAERRRASGLGGLPSWLRPATLLPAAALLIFVGVGLVWFTQSEQARNLQTFEASAPQESADDEVSATAEADANGEEDGRQRTEGAAGADAGATQEAQALEQADPALPPQPGQVLNLRFYGESTTEDARRVFETLTRLRPTPSPAMEEGAYVTRMLPEDVAVLIESLREAGLMLEITSTSPADLPPGLAQTADDAPLLRPLTGMEGFESVPPADAAVDQESTVLVVALTG